MPETTDGQYYESPQSSSRVSLASAARTTSAAGSAFTTQDVEELEAELNITAASGTTPTLDVRLETKTDTGDWYTVESFPQQTDTVANVGRVFDGLGDQCRWAWTVGGTDPSFTFSVDAETERR